MKQREVDLDDFVYHMIKYANGVKYIYEEQIKHIIDYTKKFYSCDASERDITERFIEAYKILMLA